MARPRKKIDPEQVEKLAAINCSYEEIAAVLGCGSRTLMRRFGAAVQAGRAKGKMSLRRKQYDVAMNGSTSMLIWLGKQLLDQKDKSEIDLNKFTDDELAHIVEERLKRSSGPEKP